MKKVILILALIMVCSSAHADVTRKILSQSIDENGNVRVVTQYKIDGKTVNEKAQECSNCVQGSRYSFTNFLDMTTAEKKAYIEADIDKHTVNLVIRKFTSEENKKLIDEIDALIGKEKTVKEGVLRVSDTEEWTVKTDGTKTVKIIEAAEVAK